MDATDRNIINALQGGFPVSAAPFADAAAPLGLEEGDLITRIDAMLDEGTLTRFGPLFDAEAMGGAVTLSAMAVPADDFDGVAELVNSYPEVAHNYEREHQLNMWFVVAAESRETIDRVLADIEAQTNLAVHDMPKENEFFIGLKLEV